MRGTRELISCGLVRVGIDAQGFGVGLVAQGFEVDFVAFLGDGVAVELGEFVGEIAAVVSTTAFLALQAAFGDEREYGPDVADFVVDARGVGEGSAG